MWKKFITITLASFLFLGSVNSAYAQFWKKWFNKSEQASEMEAKDDKVIKKEAEEKKTRYEAASKERGDELRRTQEQVDQIQKIHEINRTQRSLNNIKRINEMNRQRKQAEEINRLNRMQKNLNNLKRVKRANK